MRRVYKRIGIGICIVIAVSLVVLYLTQSLWFLRGILGEKAALLEFGYTSVSQLEALSGNSIINQIHSNIGLDISDIIRLVYLRDNTYEYLVLIPSPWHQIDMYESLRAAGWSPQREGWIVVGQRPYSGSVKDNSGNNNVRTIRLMSGIVQQFTMIFKQQLPWNPLFFFRIQKGEYALDTPISVYATTYSTNAIHAYVQFADMYPRPTKPMEQKISNNSYDLLFSIQRDVLQHTTRQINQAFQQLLMSALHTTKSSPDLLSAIPKDSSVVIAQRGENIGFGVYGHSDVFGFNIVRMLSQEQGDRHPERKTFMLPDGTVSHEYIPTRPVVTFTSQSQQSNCKKADGYDDSFFLCAQDALSVVSLHEDLARSVLSDMSEDISKDHQAIEGYISSSEIEKIFPGTRIYTLQVTGNENSLDILVNTK